MNNVKLSDKYNYREFTIGVATAAWIEQMMLKFTGYAADVDFPIISPETALEMLSQGAFMCTFGEFIIDPTEAKRDKMNRTLQAMGSSFRF